MLIVVGDICLEGHTPQFCCRAAPVLQNSFFGNDFFCGVAIVDVDFIAVANGDVAGFGNLDAAEKGLVG